MDIGVPLRELGDIDTSALRDAILSQEQAAWHEDEYRQDEYDVHRQKTHRIRGAFFFVSNQRVLGERHGVRFFWRRPFVGHLSSLSRT